MEKISFDSLFIETTRRCNMMCRHCGQGNAQNVDIDFAYIDALLDKTNIIGSLMLTGGEPTLNLDALDHILDKLVQNRIPVLCVNTITNGLIYSERFVNIIKDFSEYVKISRKYCVIDKAATSDANRLMVGVGISQDRYHEHPELCKKNFDKYSKALSECATVIPNADGNKPLKVGRAVDLAEAMPADKIIAYDRSRRIEIFDKEHTPVCKLGFLYHLISPDQKIVLCEVGLTVHGMLISGGLIHNLTHEQVDKEPKICSVMDDDIWSAMLSYNEGRKTCIEAECALLRPQMQAAKWEDESKKELRCKYCHKVIQYNGRNIHCTESGGGLKCEYCGHITAKGGAA